MQSVYYCVFAVIASTAVKARRITFNENNMPIRAVDVSYGKYDHERIDYLEAVIHPRHVTTGERINFPTAGHLNYYYRVGRADGDERGHLVASQFSGPAEWYNLSPQNARVNRNLGYQAINTDWYGAECEVRRFLDQGGNRLVNWKVRMTYKGKSNRPDEYHLEVKFIENGKDNGRGIVTNIRNPFHKEDSTFWICRACCSSNHGDHCSKQ